ncbi:MAG: hypothetical protein LQ352_007420 [Teloschistes flavicans]|nr:MAG: hypothetical protein LQ352_007420 [Teloschistes flavicans]
MSLAFEYEIFTSIRLLHYADDRQDSGNETLNYDHFDYKLNTTICPDATVCPQNFFSTADNTTCCDNHQGKTEINYHNDAVIPIAASDLPDYYASAGYTIPTNGVYQTATYSTFTATTRSSPISAAGATTTPTQPSTPTPSPTPATSSLSSGAKAGIGVGAAVAVIALIGIAIFLWMRRKKHLRRADAVGGMGPGAGGYGHSGVRYQGVPAQNPMLHGSGQPGGHYFKSEMPSDSARLEMDTESPTVGRRTHEMQG